MRTLFVSQEMLHLCTRDKSKARFRRRTFHEPNLIRIIKADLNYLDRRLNSVIQTQLLIPAGLNSKGEKCSFWSNCLQNTSL